MRLGRHCHFLIRLAILPFCPEPLPFCPDDFSFMLAADTFAHGRLTNPTPAMWVHFESIHITMHPTYMSMYFPGQGLLMAAGKVVLGDPWYASSDLQCADVCCHLLDAASLAAAEWALLGGTIAMIRLGLFSYWTNTFHRPDRWRPWVAHSFWGAMPRLMKTQRIRYAF